MAAARFEQRRRAGRPLAGTGLTVFPLTRPVIAWDKQAASAFSCQRIVQATTWVTQPLSFKVTATPASRCLRGGIRQYCEVSENHSRGRPQRCVQKLSAPYGMTLYPPVSPASARSLIDSSVREGQGE